jgi:hypothetical protein
MSLEEVKERERVRTRTVCQVDYSKKWSQRGLSKVDNLPKEKEREKSGRAAAVKAKNETLIKKQKRRPKQTNKRMKIKSEIRKMEL